MGFAHFFHLDEEDLLGLVPVGEASGSYDEGSGGSGTGGESLPHGGGAQPQPDQTGALAGLSAEIENLSGQVAELSSAGPAETAPAAEAPGPVGDPHYPGGVAPHVSENQPGTGGWVRVGPASAAVSHTMTTKPIKKAVH